VWPPAPLVTLIDLWRESSRHLSLKITPYAYSVFQVEYSRNLLFHRGSQLEQVFQRMVDRTRARLDVPQVKTLFGAKRRPNWRWKHHVPPRVVVVIETLAYDLTVFKVHFGNLTLKAYTKGERVLRIEAVAHNTQQLGCGRVVARLPTMVARLTDMLERFMTTLDCVDVAFISDEALDQLPLPAQVGKTRVGGIDLNNRRMRSALTAALALSPSPSGFNVGQFRAKVHSMTGQREYTHRQATYDLKKLRAKELITKLGRTRRYHVSPPGMRAITAVLVSCDQIIKPILAAVRVPSRVPKPTISTPVDRHYEQIRLDMQPLFQELGIAA
jgi:hypothetical protein